MENGDWMEAAWTAILNSQLWVTLQAAVYFLVGYFICFASVISSHWPVDIGENKMEKEHTGLRE